MSAHTDRASYLEADHQNPDRHFGKATRCPSCQFPRYRRPWTDELYCLNRDCAGYQPKPINPHLWRGG